MSEVMKHNDTVEVKTFLFNKLKEENAFWSYEPSSVTLDTVTDEILIAKTLRHLDIEEIDLLFDIYSPKAIKEAWKKLMVPEGEYLRTLNRFIAWFYFNIKNPDRYLKTLETKHLKQLFNV